MQNMLGLCQPYIKSEITRAMSSQLLPLSLRYNKLAPMDIDSDTSISLSSNAAHCLETDPSSSPGSDDSDIRNDSADGNSSV